MTAATLESTSLRLRFGGCGGTLRSTARSQRRHVRAPGGCVLGSATVDTDVMTASPRRLSGRYRGAVQAEGARTSRSSFLTGLVYAGPDAW